MTEAELAASCTQGAETLVAGLRRDQGITTLDFSIASGERVDNLIDTLISADPIPDQMQLLIGLYVGEILVRHLGGRWVADATFNQPAIRLPAGFAYPVEKVKKRVAFGPNESVAQFVKLLSQGPPSAPRAEKRGWWRRTKSN